MAGIDRYNKEKFESILYQHFPFAESLGLIDGEECYSLPVNGHTRVFVRSSVKADGLAADCSDDSIRMWIQIFRPHWSFPHNMQWLATGKKLDGHTKRTSGWISNMPKKLTVLFERAAQVHLQPGFCPKCGRTFRVGFSKTARSLNRPYAKCGDECKEFHWLDEAPKKGDKLFVGEGAKNGPEFDDLAWDDKAHGTEPDPVEEDEPEVDTQALKEIIEAKRIAKKVAKPKKSSGQKANAKQSKAINQPAGKNVRVLAPPGSGKTYLLVERYQKMVEVDGINPEDILMVTFSKDMATEMGERVKAKVSNACLTQISSIHAFCFRALTKWWDSSPFVGFGKVEDWKVKERLQELIKEYWDDGYWKNEDDDKIPQDTLPGWKEVLAVIDASKYDGERPENSVNFFRKSQRHGHAEYLAIIRQKFDKWLLLGRAFTFADMLYYMETSLQDNDGFRYLMQDAFSYVIVDEAQDTDYQGLRILVTVAAEPGLNPVYDNPNLI